MALFVTKGLPEFAIAGDPNQFGGNIILYAVREILQDPPSAPGKTLNNLKETFQKVTVESF